MALKSGRTGVRHDQVNIDGLPISSDFFNALVNDLPTWTDLPSYKNGTEQLIPVNDDEPDTSPILCNIQYPDSLRNDQYFTYRESPTTKDGLAKIRGIRGNTLVWNQLVQNGDFSNGTTGWSVGGTRGTISASNNVCTYTVVTTDSSLGNSRIFTSFVAVPNHKYLVSCSVKPKYNSTFRFAINTSPSTYNDKTMTANVWNNMSAILTPTSTSTAIWYSATCSSADGYAVGDTVDYKNCVCFDLTAMGYDSLTVEQFRKLYSLDYYAHNSGSLLSFNGTGIKTVCKNLNSLKGVNKTNEYGLKMTVNDDATVHIKGTATRQVDYPLGATNNTYLNLPNGSYKFSGITGGSGTTYKLYVAIKSNVTGTLRYTGIETGDGSFTLDNEVVRMFVRIYDTAEVDFMVYPMIRFASAESGFIPYEYKETELPIDTFFPTGMKSAGTAYDELIPTKAITRIGAIDLGTLDWTYNSTEGHLRFISSAITGVKTVSSGKANILCAIYETQTEGSVFSNLAKGICLISTGVLMVYDSSYTDATTFKSAMSGVYLFYELATPVVEATMSFE